MISSCIYLLRATDSRRLGANRRTLMLKGDRVLCCVILILGELPTTQQAVALDELRDNGLLALRGDRSFSHS